MDKLKITPEAYRKIFEAYKEARKVRDETIRQMRNSDSEYWTFERLATHWHMTKQNVEIICKKG
jgi:hypothetical protein